jgi:uncharacterized protein YecE (DUF72 family)
MPKMTTRQESEAAKIGSLAVRVGCAGWSIPPRYAHEAATLGSHLQRYSQVFNCCEINSSFRRSHKPATWQRWAASVPGDFRFSVKLPRAITHDAKLKCGPELLTDFLQQVHYLDGKLGPLLVQTPPSLEFEIGTVKEFFALLRQHYGGDVVCEPRHSTWFVDRADECLRTFRVARAASDPACVPNAADPGGFPELAYFRLHGSPRPYYSRYPQEFVKQVAGKLQKRPRVWCIFDNTAAGWAFENALQLTKEVGAGAEPRSQRDA